MYRKKQREQVEFEDFYLSFGGRLRSDNRWVRLAKLVPWAEIESHYAELFNERIGAPAISARVAVASLIIKEKLGLSDEETVEQIRENPYLQYFLGYEAYTDEAPFDPSMMVHFRRRLDESVLGEINCLIVDRQRERDQKARRDEPEGDGNGSGEVGGGESAGGGDSPNAGMLLMDASCVPADIRYPTDLSILNEVREKTELIIDRLHAPDVGKNEKPRSYRQRARKDYLAVAKKRRASRKAIRKAIGKQLRYVRRNLTAIKELAGRNELSLLSRREYRNLLVCSEVYRQQNYMYENDVRSVSGRIVSVSQPHVRPIIRGKAGRPVEFGAKISASKIDGYAYLDRLSWEAYHEGEDLQPRIEAYRRRFGCYPESVHVDAIYRTRANRAYCTEHGIRISGPPLGRPKKHPTGEEKRQTREDERKRIAIEGVFGRAKRAYSLSRIMAKRADTSQTSIALAFLVMNLDTMLRHLFCLLSRMVFPLAGRQPTPRRSAIAGLSGSAFSI
ncbi:MAG: IS5 family transposase [Spirochaetales bacterium]|nr:IS5 family transposase [Spirochaetales bacterium]